MKSTIVKLFLEVLTLDSLYLSIRCVVYLYLIFIPFLFYFTV